MSICIRGFLKPLGITSSTWEKCPYGIEKGGWGLNITARDIAKIGQLYLNRGVWNVEGREVRLISESWIREATTKQVGTSGFYGPDGYGYHIWMCKPEGAYQFNGAFGQYVIVMPSFDMVLTITSNSETMFLEGGIIKAVNDFFQRKRAVYRPADPRGEKRIQSA